MTEAGSVFPTMTIADITFKSIKKRCENEMHKYASELDTLDMVLNPIEESTEKKLT